MSIEDEAAAKAESPITPELDPNGPEVATMERRQAIESVLRKPELQNPHFPERLREGWVHDLSENLPHAISRAQEANQTKTGVLQYADAHLDRPEDTAFVNAFLSAFQAGARLEGESMEVRTGNIADLMADQRFPRLPQLYEWSAGYSGHVTVDDDNQPVSLMLDTNLEGVKLVLDGPAISGDGDIVRAMLAVSLRGRPEDQAA